MATLVAPDQNLSDSVDARIEIDLRLGSAFTRFQTLSLGKKFEELSDKVSLPCGREQERASERESEKER